MKKTILIFASVAAAHWVLTILLGLVDWWAQQNSSALLPVIHPFALVLNFPIPFVLKDNSLLIMLSNSALASAMIVLIWMSLRKINNHNEKQC